MKQFALATALLLICIPAEAWAAATCTVSATALAFGSTINPFGATLKPTGTITVACVHGTSSKTFTIAANAGAGSFSQRYMTDLPAADKLNYNLYTNSGLTTIWGDGTSGTSVINGANESTTTTYPFYGELLTPQGVTPNSYTDTITMTITY